MVADKPITFRINDFLDIKMDNEIKNKRYKSKSAIINEALRNHFGISASGKVIQVRIPDGLDGKMEKKIKSNGYTDKNEIVHEALRNFLNKPKPRRIEPLIDLLGTLVEKGPKSIKEDGHEEGD